MNFIFHLHFKYFYFHLIDDDWKNFLNRRIIFPKPIDSCINSICDVCASNLNGNCYWFDFTCSKRNQESQMWLSFIQLCKVESIFIFIRLIRWFPGFIWNPIDSNQPLASRLTRYFFIGTKIQSHYKSFNLKWLEFFFIFIDLPIEHKTTLIQKYLKLADLAFRSLFWYSNIFNEKKIWILNL